jgi:phosphoglycolate phosphatase-like HAD superfamily hydrolase
MLKAVLFDVDGTLVDSNDAHAAAWVRAFADFGVTVDAGKVRRSIGMGGDKLMPAVSGIGEDTDIGSQIARRRGEIFKKEFLPHLKPLRDAGRLVGLVKKRGYTAVAASSARKDELRALLKIAGAEWLMDAATSSDDAEESKPDPDIIVAALGRAKAAPAEAVMIGDTPYDVEASMRAGVKAIGFLSGGWNADELRGAIATYEGPWDLAARIETSPLGTDGKR